MSKRTIESQVLEIKLLDGKTLSIRPLTVAERKECISKVPNDLMKLKDLESDDFASKYIDLQVDLIHYIVTRSCKDFKKEDIETKMDSSIIEQVLMGVLKDPLSELLRW